MTTPRTAAGRALHERNHEALRFGDSAHEYCDLQGILAIEAEARAAALDGLTSAHDLDVFLVSHVPLLRDELVAIGYEQGRREARAAALDEAYEAMKRLPHGRAYALAAIDALREGSGGKDSSLLAWGEHLIEERERNGE